MPTPRAGDLILYRDHDLVSWLARLGQCAPVNHVAIVNSRGDGTVEAAGPGIRRNHLPAFTADRFLYPCPDPRRGLRAAQLAESRVGQGYGYLDYLPILVRLFTRHDLPLPCFGYVCSSFAAWCWRTAGLPCAQGQPLVTVTPADIFLDLARQPAASRA
jgi:hypothetical protein